jgi:ketosteroid isomerase-like protein
MTANTPLEICEIFKRCIAAGDLEGALGIYDLDAAFVTPSGTIKRGHAGLREELSALVGQRVDFEFDVKQVVEAEGVALMHTVWKVGGEQPRTVYAIEVARRQADGSWRWLIGDPNTIGKWARLTA